MSDKNCLIQLSGTRLIGNPEKPLQQREKMHGVKSHQKVKYPQKTEDALKRTKIFYCTHYNRTEGLFRKRKYIYNKRYFEYINS